MKNRYVVVFCAIVFMMFTLIGCSNNSIKTVKLIDNNIKTNYLVGEEIEVNDFSLKITFKDNEEKIYNVTEDMVTVGEVDNTLVGNQRILVSVDYDGIKINFYVSVNFNLPEDVESIIALIDDLPSDEEICLNDEVYLNIIESRYLLIDEIYRGYVSNYDRYITARNKLLSLQNEYITPEVINNRFILKTNLDNVLHSLNRNDYSEEDWYTILEIYDFSISMLYDNSNYLEMDDIVSDAVLLINDVSTIEEVNLVNMKVEKENELLEYRNSFDVNDFSQSNWNALDNIVNRVIDNLENADSIKEVYGLYNNAVIELNAVETIEEERIALLNNALDSKVNLLKNKLISIDLNSYSDENRTIIISLYNDSVSKVRLCTDEESADNEIRKFEYKVSKIKTLEEARLENLISMRNKTIQNINDFISNLNIYKYDTQNRIFIEGCVNEAIDKIAKTESISEIEWIYEGLVSAVMDVPTMEEQAIENLPFRIENAKKAIDDYVSQINYSLYSEESYRLIQSIISEAKTYFEENIMVYTSNVTINNKISSTISEIESVLTLEAEQQILLDETKSRVAIELDNYYSQLDESDFAEGAMQYIENRIEDIKKTINNMDDIEIINRLVEETIAIIEDAKRI